MFQLEQLYTGIILAISYGFSTDFDDLPAFQDLTPTINFKNLFLMNLISTPIIKRVTSVYNRIGDMIKRRLTDSECITPVLSPKAFHIVTVNKMFSGWKILEQLLKQRVVICGARSDVDLDKVRSGLSIMPNESYSAFYLRCNDLQTEYELSMKNIILSREVKNH